jgi:hypothetical protein
VEEFADKAAELLHDKNHGVLVAGVTLMLAICTLDAGALEKYRCGRRRGVAGHGAAGQQDARAPGCGLRRAAAGVEVCGRRLRPGGVRSGPAAPHRPARGARPLPPPPPGRTSRCCARCFAACCRAARRRSTTSGGSATPSSRSRSCSCCACWVSGVGGDGDAAAERRAAKWRGSGARLCLERLAGGSLTARRLLPHSAPGRGNAEASDQMTDILAQVWGTLDGDRGSGVPPAIGKLSWLHAPPQLRRWRQQTESWPAPTPPPGGRQRGGLAQRGQRDPVRGREYHHGWVEAGGSRRLGNGALQPGQGEGSIRPGSSLPARATTDPARPPAPRAPQPPRH